MEIKPDVKFDRKTRNQWINKKIQINKNNFQNILCKEFGLQFFLLCILYNTYCYNKTI